MNNLESKITSKRGRPRRSLDLQVNNLGSKPEGDQKLRLERIDLNLFQVFEAIYSNSSLSAAARQLGVTQPAVSAGLRRLRSILGDELFIRVGRGVAPTILAREMIHPIRNSLQGIEDVLNTQGTFLPRDSFRKFRLSISDRIEEELLPLIMVKLSQVAPNIRIRSRHLSSSETEDRLATGYIDFAVEPADISISQKLIHQPLIHSKIVCMVRPAHPFATKSELTLDEYLSLSHILVSNRENLEYSRGIVDRALAEHNGKREIKLRCQHRLVVPTVLRETDLAYTGEISFANRHGLTALNLPFDIPPTNLHLYWHSSQDKDSGHIWFKNLIVEAAQQRQASNERRDNSTL